MNHPDQLADTWKWLASVGPSTSTGSSAIVTAATMSSRIMILGSLRAMTKPSLSFD